MAAAISKFNAYIKESGLNKRTVKKDLLFDIAYKWILGLCPNFTELTAPQQQNVIYAIALDDFWDDAMDIGYDV